MPFGIFVLFFLCAVALLLIIGPRIQIKKSALLLRHFQGKFDYPSGMLEIPFSGTRFRIMRLARGAGVNNSVGGTYATLWTYTSETPKFFIGNALSGKYSNGHFLILPPHVTVAIGGFSFLIGSKSQELRERAQKLLMEDPTLAQKLSQLFEKEFAQLTLSVETHIRSFSFQRKTVLRYKVLSEEIYQQPESLEPVLQTITDFAEKLGISFDPS